VTDQNSEPVGDEQQGMTEDTDESNFRGQVTQKGIVCCEDEVLLVRSATDDSWSIPGGRVQDGENADEGLARELREETALSVRVGEPVQTLTDVWYTGDGEAMFTVVYACSADERDVTLNHEHEEYEWVETATARERLPLDSLTVAVERARRWYRRTDPESA
jgi:8-oxo-dGTP diphosphatase